MPERVRLDPTTGEFVRVGGTSKPPTPAQTPQAETGAFLPGPEEFKNRLVRAADEFGLAETLGGLLGGAAGSVIALPGVGTVTGAMTGAGLANALKNYFKSGEIEALPALGTAALEGAVPGLGKVTSKMGRGLVRSTLPLSEELMRLFGGQGPGALTQGTNAVMDLVDAVPGVRLSTTANNAQKAVRGGMRLKNAAYDAARESGATAGVGQVLNDAARRLPNLRRRVGPPSVESGANDVLGRFQAQLDEVAPNGGVTADDLRSFLDATPFEAYDDKGAQAAVEAVRKALSSTVKGLHPELKHAYNTLAKNYPVEQLLDRLQASGSQMQAAPELFGSTRRGVGVFGMIKPPAFASGRTMQAVGRLLNKPGAAGTARSLPELLSIILNGDQEP